MCLIFSTHEPKKTGIIFQFNTLTHFNIPPSSYSKDINATFPNFLSAQEESCSSGGRAGGRYDVLHTQAGRRGSVSFVLGAEGLMCVNREPSCPAWVLIQQAVKESCRLTDKGAVRWGQADMDSQSSSALVRCLRGLTPKLPVLSLPLSRGQRSTI